MLAVSFVQIIAGSLVCVGITSFMILVKKHIFELSDDLHALKFQHKNLEEKLNDEISFLKNVAYSTITNAQIDWVNKMTDQG